MPERRDSSSSDFTAWTMIETVLAFVVAAFRPSTYRKPKGGR